jgi:hypothetical protein
LLAAKNSAKQAAELKMPIVSQSVGRGGDGRIGDSANGQLRTVYTGGRPVGAALWALADDLADRCQRQTLDGGGMEERNQHALQTYSKKFKKV